MNVVAVIQARMGSSRLPGKVMLPLKGEHVLNHDIQRVASAGTVNEVTVATSTKTADDIVERYTELAGATVFRGSETDVLGRMFGAAAEANADIVVRITGDCPLVSPTVIDAVVRTLKETGVDYCTNILDRTFPRGLDVEAFTFESFREVSEVTTEPHHREHVTPYYREHPEKFDLANVESTDVYEEAYMRDRSELRLTLDVADDYELLRKVYENLDFEGLLDVRDVVKYVDENDLTEINEQIDQKPVKNASDNSS